MINFPAKVFSRAYLTLSTLRNFASNPLADLRLLEEGLARRNNPIDSHYEEAVVERILM